MRRVIEVIASLFEALTSETDGLIDFRRDDDARINREVTQYELREMLRHGNYDIVHFAGHAAFDRQRPESSAWLLSDGPFSAQAIRNTLRWRESQPWLVFANACEAGMDGKVPTMYQTDCMPECVPRSWCRAFIGPLWRIDDTVAANIAGVISSS
jgi:CHAT domain-containing protein